MPWLMLPSIWFVSPSGLMISPQSWATTTLVTRTAPQPGSTDTSATTATYVYLDSYRAKAMPRPGEGAPAAITVRLDPIGPDGRVRHLAACAARRITAVARGSVRWPRRNATGSAPA